MQQVMQYVSVSGSYMKTGNKDYFVSWCYHSHRYLAPSSRSMIAVSILL